MLVKELKCPNCGSNIPDSSHSCEYCGTRLILSQDRNTFIIAGAVCRKCGTNNKESSHYCKDCGLTLVKTCPACTGTIEVAAMHCPDCGANYSESTDLILQSVTLLKTKLFKTRKNRMYYFIGAGSSFGMSLLSGGMFAGGVSYQFVSFQVTLK